MMFAVTNMGTACELIQDQTITECLVSHSVWVHHCLVNVSSHILMLSLVLISQCLPCKVLSRNKTV